MSAFLVVNGHIDVLVVALQHYGITGSRRGGFQGRRAIHRPIGQMLLVENVASVNYRYREQEQAPTYILHTTRQTLSPVAILQAIDCYDYQSQEHPGWERSRAYQLISRLRQAVYAAYPEVAQPVYLPWLWATVPAYRDMNECGRLPWEFDGLAQAVATGRDKATGRPIVAPA